MNKRPALTQQERELFREAVAGARPVKQDTHAPHRRAQDRSRPTPGRADSAPRQEFWFSDEFQPLIADEGPVRYTRLDVSPDETKKLRRGMYAPDIWLDLHGLTQQEAKRELSALLALCHREQLPCACVMHGYGRQILKARVPLWLAQHPHVMAFHQAPKTYGGDAALLVLIETVADDTLPPRR